MARTAAPQQLVIASHNPGKVAEIGELLGDYVTETVSAGALGLAEPAETGSSFAENAALKARAAATGSGKLALADDSGLSVAALGGAPGIYSARWAGPEKDFDAAMQAVADALEEVEASDYSAKFVCALALAWPDGHVETLEGTVAGQLTWPPRGELGFGYDPIFVPTGEDRTFAEMPPAEKHAMSHRRHAFDKLVARCFAG